MCPLDYIPCTAEPYYRKCQLFACCTAIPGTCLRHDNSQCSTRYCRNKVVLNSPSTVVINHHHHDHHRSGQTSPASSSAKPLCVSFLCHANCSLIGTRSKPTTNRRPDRMYFPTLHCDRYHCPARGEHRVRDALPHGGRKKSEECVGTNINAGGCGVPID